MFKKSETNFRGGVSVIVETDDHRDGVGKRKRGGKSHTEAAMTAREFIKIYSPALTAMLIYFAFVGMGLATHNPAL